MKALNRKIWEFNDVIDFMAQNDPNGEYDNVPDTIEVRNDLIETLTLWALDAYGSPIFDTCKEAIAALYTGDIELCNCFVVVYNSTIDGIRVDTFNTSVEARACITKDVKRVQGLLIDMGYSYTVTNNNYENVTLQIENMDISYQWMIKGSFFKEEI